MNEKMCIDKLIECTTKLTKCEAKTSEGSKATIEPICIPPPKDQRPESFMSIDGKVSYIDYDTGEDMSEEEYRKLMCLPPKKQLGKYGGCVPDPDATFSPFANPKYHYKGRAILEEEYRKLRCLD